MIGEILVKTLTCLLMSPSFLACWRGDKSINDKSDLFIYFYINIHIYIIKYI